jgi:peptidoglycan/xylan/chitin deacetylase (PgdA/CDA1 family)
MYLAQTPPLLKAMASHLVWSGPSSLAGRPAVYLTFDDGPHPTITPAVHALLAAYQARATFFCVGANILRFPETHAATLAAGHRVGNHTQDHVSGWATPDRAYYRNYLACQQLTGTALFRPPYGRITRSQARCLHRHTQIVMWDVLSADFDASLTPQACLDLLQTHTRPGSIVVFHDSEKAAVRMLPALEKYLVWMGENGYVTGLL